MVLQRPSMGALLLPVAMLLASPHAGGALRAKPEEEGYKHAVEHGRTMSGLRLRDQYSGFEQCKASAQQETTAGLRIAYILRGESFRGGNLSEHVTNQSEWENKQFGPRKRLTCGSGTFEQQKMLANRQFKTIKFLESMGYSVDLFGASYECDDATKSDSFNFTVQEGLATLYNFTRLTILDKKTSTQISAIRAGFHLMTELHNDADHLYKAVILGRWDNVYDIKRWACHLADMDFPQDLFTLEGVGNDDNLMVVPQRHIQCFDAFLKENESTLPLPCCHGHCGGGDCHPCVRNFAETVHGKKLLRETFPTCGEQNYHVRERAEPHNPIYSDNPDWLPDSDRDCIEEKNEENEHHGTPPRGDK